MNALWNFIGGYIAINILTDFAVGVKAAANEKLTDKKVAWKALAYFAAGIVIVMLVVYYL